jgi:hypothetical protein
MITFLRAYPEAERPFCPAGTPVVDLTRLRTLSRPAVSQTSIWFDADAIIDGVAEALLAAQISLGRLDAHVAQQKLNLLQLAARLMTKAVRTFDEDRVVRRLTYRTLSNRP